jgi:hypothetical protein
MDLNSLNQVVARDACRKPVQTLIAKGCLPSYCRPQPEGNQGDKWKGGTHGSSPSQPKAKFVRLTHTLIHEEE